MCDVDEASTPGSHATFGRRRFITASAGVASAAFVGSVAPFAGTAAPGGVEVAPGLVVRPRDQWGSDLPPTGPPEPEEVRFLLVHHTATSDTATDPRSVIRSIHRFHTGPDKGWIDVCYHFFVAPDGSIWEGRAGSLDGPVIADATGGNQGFAQLVCSIGDHRTTPPTPLAQESIVRLLWWLRWRYRLPTGSEATARFVSRGSNRHPAGESVTTPVIAGHRDHSATACPGDAAYDLLPSWRRAVASLADPVFPDDGRHRRARRGNVTDVGTDSRAELGAAP